MEDPFEPVRDLLDYEFCRHIFHSECLRRRLEPNPQNQLAWDCPECHKSIRSFPIPDHPVRLRRVVWLRETALWMNLYFLRWIQPYHCG